ncbi:integrator complex subunit 8 [Ditylenchus destructor]|nr:integrator complex subunit 8 [Ditylenchus destructor]
MKPTTSWFDYFMDRKEFFKLLEDPQKDENAVAQIADQFIEQAMNAEKELVQIEKKQLDEEDSICMRHKMDQLWMCALSCFAAIHWDLKLLDKNSNAIKIHALMTRFNRWVFVEQLNNNATNEDPFTILYALGANSFTSKNTFAMWLFSRWVLMVDTDARFPAPLARPTVSNPLNQTDHNLVLAERLTQFIMEIRRKTPDAAKLLEDLLSQPTEVIEVPLKDCFYISKEITLPLEELKKLPTPNFSTGNLELRRPAFRIKTTYDLMVAHFAARHFQKAKKLLTTVVQGFQISQNVKSDVARILSIDENELEGYKAALNGQKQPLLSTPNGTQKAERESDYIIQAASLRDDCSPKVLIALIKQGMGISKRLQFRLQDEKFRNAFIDEAALEFSRVNDQKSASAKKIRAQLFSSLYFLCALSPRFSETIRRHPQLNKIGNGWRDLVTSRETRIPPPPPNEHIERLSESGPPLWNILTSFKFNVIRESCDILAKTGFKLPTGLRVSDITGDEIQQRSQKTPKYNQIVIQLWKLEQLMALENSVRWEKTLNTFAQTDIANILSEHKELNVLWMYDLLRVRIDIWNRRLCRTDDVAKYENEIISGMENIRSTVLLATNTKNYAFLKFIVPLINFLLNKKEWKFIWEKLENTYFTSPFTSLGRLLSTYLLHAHELNDQGKASQIAVSMIWTILWPTFETPKTEAELRKERRRPVQKLLEPDKLLDFLKMLKESAALDFLLSYTAYMYNLTLTAPMEVDRFELDAAILAHKRIFVKNEDMWRPVTGNGTHLSVEYIEKVLEILCTNALIVNPVNTVWLKIVGDFHFAKRQYEKAATLYLEVIATIQRGFSMDNMNPKDLDWIYSKISLCCAALQMPTLAAMVGQLRTDIEPHLHQVEWLLKETPNTVDAGPAYFPLIADLNLLERMAAAYTRHNLTLYAQNLIKSAPSKALNVNNSPEILRCEMERRKKRFLEILFNQFFRQNM